MDWKASRLEVCIFLTLVPLCTAITLSLLALCVTTTDSAKGALAATAIAAFRLRTASVEGLSLDLCAPTSAMGPGALLKAKARAAAV